MAEDAGLRMLVIGASYGLLPAVKIAASGHRVTVVGRAEEITAIQHSGVSLSFGTGETLVPPKGSHALRFATPEIVDPSEFDIVLLALQEPQARASEIASLMRRIGDRLPVASVMNMPPPPFLDRVSKLSVSVRSGVFGAEEAWSVFPAERMTLASPDPQVFRPDSARPGHLQVTLASNFKFAPFVRSEDQSVLTRIARDASRLTTNWGRVPVHLLARASLFTPLAKWPMLVTGNCRCLSDAGVLLSICDAVEQDLVVSRMLYEGVNEGLRWLGAPESVLVPFDAYLIASRQLVRPSSLARSLMNGATAVERIDLLVLGLMQEAPAQQDVLIELHRISALISAKLLENQKNG